MVYHCYDEYAAFDGTDRERVTAMETRLLESADVVFAVSEGLRTLKARVNPNTHLVPNGVEYELFAAAQDPATPLAAELRDLPKPVVGAPGAVRPSLTREASWLLLARTAGFALTFALPMLLVRTLTQHEFGVYKQAFLIVQTALTVLPLGFGMGVVVTRAPCPLQSVSRSARPVRPTYWRAPPPVAASPTPVNPSASRGRWHPPIRPRHLPSRSHR